MTSNNRDDKKTKSLVLDEAERLNRELLLNNVEELALLVLALEHLIGDKRSSSNLLLVMKTLIVVGALRGALRGVGSRLRGVALHEALPL